VSGIYDTCPKIGVEEEYFLVHCDSRSVSPTDVTVLNRALREHPTVVSGEYTQYQIEAKTPPCFRLEELHGHLNRMRTLVTRTAAREGFLPVATGCPVLGACLPPPVRDDARCRASADTYRSVNDDYTISAMHTHVDIPSRHEAVLVSNHLRPWLPLLIALSGNSPFWMERDTGYSSWRTVIKSHGPADGPPPFFQDQSEFEETVRALQGIGVIDKPQDVLWDVRPSGHLPTIEIRAMDVLPTAWESAALAGIVRALVTQGIDSVRHGHLGPIVPQNVLRAACWQAARYGVSATVWHPLACSLKPVGMVANHLLAYTREPLREYGDFDAAAAFVSQVRSQGNGGDRQRRAFSRKNDLRDVVDDLSRQTCQTEREAVAR
jgi:carboxylate-amine ligase